MNADNITVNITNTIPTYTYIEMGNDAFKLVTKYLTIPSIIQSIVNTNNVIAIVVIILFLFLN